MTKDEAIKQLKEQQSNCDTECAHYEADDIICKLLESLGYEDVVEEYRNVNKWYT